MIPSWPNPSKPSVIQTPETIYSQRKINPIVPGNQTQFTEFILLRFSEKPEQQGPLFGLFLGIYLVTVVGNLLIMLAIGSDSHLHTPMYFFLSNLSFVDLCVISTTVPNMLMSILTQNKTISYANCLVQMYFFMVFVGLDNFLLTAMAYDRFVAICHPLRYTAIMNPRLCGLLVLLSWIISFLNALLHSLMVTRLMGPENQTYVSEFLLLGLSEKPEQQLPLFGLFLSIYVVTVVGNLLIMLAIGSDSHLHTPMYFFLSNLSFVDFCLVSTTVPKMLVNIITHSKVIFYAECLAQMYFFMVFAFLDNFLLTVMAYDRFVAICHPLHYVTIMSPRICGRLVLISWISVVSLFYGTGLGVYLSSSANHSFWKTSVASVMYSVVTPMLNPFIYSMRNKDIKDAIRRLINKMPHYH
ncbi:olfactory receptor-like protein OLF4 [Sarcophilus harrisii]|uniref:olfactory receptor-like protein OLF4 n=1 Tax=Sarcophilus harrisii TaxID=9305 RepID=UPI001301E7C3|nr:olfactory receptor-like protein OLF4 [Sarcophilus harrisii]